MKTFVFIVKDISLLRNKDSPFRGHTSSAVSVACHEHIAFDIPMKHHGVADCSLQGAL